MQLINGIWRPGQSYTAGSGGGGGGSEPMFGTGDTTLFQDGFETWATPQLYFDHRNDGGFGNFHITSASPDSGAAGVTTADGVFVTGRTGSGNAWRQSYSGAAQENHYLYLSGCSEDNAAPVDFNDGFDPDHGLLITEWYSRVIISVPLAQFDGWRIKYFMMFMREPTAQGGGYATRLQMNTADQPVGPAFGSLWQALQGGYDTDSECQAISPTATEMVNAGAWFRNKVAYQPNSSLGARDGLARMWINGTKIVDISASAAGVTPPGGAKTWCDITDVDTLGLCNPVSPATTGTSIDRFVGPLRWGDILTTDNNPFTIDYDDIHVWNRARIVSP